MEGPKINPVIRQAGYSAAQGNTEKDSGDADGKNFQQAAESLAGGGAAGALTKAKNVANQADGKTHKIGSTDGRNKKNAPKTVPIKRTLEDGTEIVEMMTGFLLAIA